MKTRQFTVSIIFMLLISQLGWSQENQDSNPSAWGKYSLYGSFGVLPSQSWTMVSGNLERRLYANQNKFITSIWARLGAGYAKDALSDYFIILGGATALTGKGSSHLELGLGLTYLNQLRDEDQYFGPLANAGYRYQKQKGFFFRAGVGLPETIYASIGFGF